MENSSKQSEDQGTPTAPPTDKKEQPKNIYILPFDIIIVFIGIALSVDLASAVASAIESGQVQLSPKIRHDPAQTVDWHRAWSLLFGGGWLFLIFIRYLYRRAAFIVCPEKVSLSELDSWFALSALPAGMLYLFSGWLSNTRDAMSLGLGIITFAIPCYVTLKHGTRAGTISIFAMVVLFLIFITSR